MGITWLHLSDWHQRLKDYDREEVRDKLIADLERRAAIDPRLAKIDFIVFSGDLAFSGAAAEYEAAGKEFLDPVLVATGVPKNRLFLIPGNHDLFRPALKLLAELRSLFKVERDINEVLLDEDTREVLLVPMRAYSRFVRGYLGDAAPKEPAYSYLSQFSVDGNSIALVGMNSAWMCAQHEELNPITHELEVRDQGYLLLGEPQFSRPARASEFKDAAVRIGVLHHPSDWFDKTLSRWRVDADLEQTFNVLLRGHEHDSLAASKSGPGGACMIISAGAAYDRREYPNGYNFAHLDLDSGQGTLFFRRYDDQIGFHEDTQTTGDAARGRYFFDLPWRKRPSVVLSPTPPSTLASPAVVPQLCVEQIFDAHSPDVLAALDLYTARIPENEALQTPDLIRFLREDQARLVAGLPPLDFFFVAKREDRVHGFALMHSDQGRNLAFIAYLVAEKGVVVDDGTVSSYLLAEVAKLFAQGGALAHCKGILLEVDDPRLAGDEDERRERVARIRLFCNLAEREGFALRALDFDYRQPLLEIPAPADRGKELEMLLMYAQRQAVDLDGALPRERVQGLLAFIYKWLYPEGFSNIATENDAYRQYVEELCVEQFGRLPEEVPLLGLARIRARRASRPEGATALN
jgi:predicted phosphodiesterase